MVEAPGRILACLWAAVVAAVEPAAQCLRCQEPAPLVRLPLQVLQQQPALPVDAEAAVEQQADKVAAVVRAVVVDKPKRRAAALQGPRLQAERVAVHPIPNNWNVPSSIRARRSPRNIESIRS